METPRRPRWGQLTYSSFDRHDGRGGGWQVKDTTGDLDAAETELLRGAVETQFDAGIELPRFPTPAQIEELPRRLVHAPAGERGETALWHHVPAGTDASGRPGNVFAHVVLDRTPEVADPVRPIERWRSPRWLTPFGADKVLTAELTGSEPPEPGPVSRQTISSWLFAPRQWRMQTLTVLLDALRHALGGGPMVVVGVEDVDEGANWIAALSFAMSAGAARRFHFSTLERPSALAGALRRELHLVCVPRPDFPALAKHEGIVVVDPGAELFLGDLDGEPHRTARGDWIPAGEWSALITEVFVDPKAMVQAVGQFDQIAHTIGDSGLDPAWPAAMLVSRMPEAGARTEAGRVMASCAPPHLRSVPELFETAVGALRRQVDGSVAKAWAQVERVGADAPDRAYATVAGEVAVRVYAELALAAEPWLAESGPARIPTAHYYSPAPEPGLVQLAILLAPHISPHSEELPPAVGLDEARAGLHFVELALRLGLAHDEALAAQLWQICQQSLLPVLLDVGLATELLDSVHRTIAAETRHWLWSQLGATGLEALGAPGRRLAPPVLESLGPGPDDPDPLAVTWSWLQGETAATANVSPLVGEYAWYRCQRGDDGLEARFFAAWSALDAYARLGEASGLEDAARLLEPIWPTERLALLHEVFATAVPGQWYLGHLLEHVDDEDATELWIGVADRPDRPRIAELARLRIFVAQDDWISHCEPMWLAQDLGELVDALAAARQHRLQPDPEFLRRADGLVVLALIAARGRVPGVDARRLETVAGQAQAAIAAWTGAGTGFTPEEAAVLVSWCDRYHVESTALAELFLLADPRSALRSGTDRVAGWLHAVGTGAPDSAPITAMVLAARASRSADTRDQVADEVLRAARTAPGSADDRASRSAERFLAGWLRQAQSGRVRR